MANNPKKVKDPTEVALSAIQEALNISDAPIDSSRDSIRSDVTPANSSSSQDYNPSAFDTRPSADRQTFESVEDMRPTRRAANDDRETIGQILQAIQNGRPGGHVLCAGAAVLFPGQPFLARPGVADDRAVDGAGCDPFFGARGRDKRLDGNGWPGDPPRSRGDGRRRRTRDCARRRT